MSGLRETGVNRGVSGNFAQLASRQADECFVMSFRHFGTQLSGPVSEQTPVGKACGTPEQPEEVRQPA
jgi:hypothetical protein